MASHSAIRSRAPTESFQDGSAFALVCRTGQSGMVATQAMASLQFAAA